MLGGMVVGFCVLGCSVCNLSSSTLISSLFFLGCSLTSFSRTSLILSLFDVLGLSSVSTLISSLDLISPVVSAVRFLHSFK
jgi:hypothetical protein